MPLIIKNAEVERLAREVARLAGESRIEAVRKALEERRGRLAYRVVCDDRIARLRAFLERDVWPRVPRNEIGRRLPRRRQNEVLGYGPKGV